MIIKLKNYSISINKNNIKIVSNTNTNDFIDMILFTDYNYDILYTGLLLHNNPGRTILSAEYAITENKEFYNVTINIDIREMLYITIYANDITNDQGTRRIIYSIIDTVEKIINDKEEL